MQHLLEMCCDQCRAKVEEIERRSLIDPENYQAAQDCRELLMLLEASLRTLATRREQFRNAADAMALGVAELQAERTLLRDSLRWVLDNGILKAVSHVDGQRYSRLVENASNDAAEPPERLRATLAVILALSDLEPAP